MDEKAERGNDSSLLMNQVFDESYQKISDLVAGHTRYCILLSALESGTVDLLGKAGGMAEELLLTRTGCMPESGHLWIDVLVETGIFTRKGKQVQINPALSPYLVSGSPLYQGDSIFSARESVWSCGTEFLKKKEEPAGRPGRKMTPEFLRVVAQHAMRGELQEITRILTSLKEFHSARRMLDIGGGHGMYSISFCQQNPGLSVVILDQPHITRSTRETAERFMIGDRIEVIAGDMNEELPGTGYDLVYASHIFYQKEDLSFMIHRIFQVLRAGGLFISNHKFAEDWKNPENNALATLENEIIREYHLMIPQQDFLEILIDDGLDLKGTWKVPATTGLSTLHIAQK